MINKYNFKDLLSNNRELKVVLRNNYGIRPWGCDVSENSYGILNDGGGSGDFYVEVIP